MALRSMTGFGLAEGELSSRLRATVRISSVNSRFLEVVVRTHPRLDSAEWEPLLRGVVAEAVTRGRVAVTIDLEGESGSCGVVSINWGVAEALVTALEQRPPRIELAPLSLRDLLGIPGFLEGVGELVLEADERQQLVELVRAACRSLVAARGEEGEALRAQLVEELGTLSRFVAWLHEQQPRLTQLLLGRLRQRLAELLEGAPVSEERLLQEAAILAERADVAEELARLEAHLAHLRALLVGEGPVGKRLEFLLQEILREVNTAASKFREVGMGEQVVAAKAALERLREQAANIE